MAENKEMERLMHIVSEYGKKWEAMEQWSLIQQKMDICAGKSV